MYCQRSQWNYSRMLDEWIDARPPCWRFRVTKSCYHSTPPTPSRPDCPLVLDPSVHDWLAVPNTPNHNHGRGRSVPALTINNVPSSSDRYSFHRILPSMRFYEVLRSDKNSPATFLWAPSPFPPLSRRVHQTIISTYMLTYGASLSAPRLWFTLFASICFIQTV